jgi:hypothetical protein
MRRICIMLLVLLGICGRADAQTDEIQVYDGGLSPRGVVNLTVHTNWIASGITQPAYPGAVTADGSVNGVPEWALGVTRWLELGLYLPVYSYDQHMGWGIDGWKPRALFAVPNADNRRFFYGANFEFSVNQKRWDEHHFTSEVRPIIGWHLTSFDIIVNPIVDTAYDGLKNLDFAPSTRFAYKRSDRLSLAAEEYADFGPISDMYSAHDQSHQLFGVVDYSLGWNVDLEAGVGFGLTDATDNLTFKVILSRDLTSHHGGAKN